MKKPNPYPGLTRDRDRHGNVRYYVRAPGRPKVRLHGQPGSEAFETAYAAAMKGEATPPPAEDRAPADAQGTLAALARAYYRSPEFASLSDATRYVRRRLLDAICLSKMPGGAKRGDLPARGMGARHVRDLRDEHARQPDAANGRVKALRQLFAWAIEARNFPSNPAREVAYLKPKRPGGFHSWSREEVLQFEARHPAGTKAHLALSIMLYTGARRCDAVKLGRQMTRNGWIFFTEAKGASRKPKHRAIPVVPELAAAITAAQRAGNCGDLTYLMTAFGQPFTVAGFGNWFRDRCDEAGLKHCSAHGLRKAGAAMAAEAGATEHQLMAIYGWDSPKQAALYTRAANRRRLAADAMSLIAAGRALGMEPFLPPANVPLEKPVGHKGENDNDNKSLEGNLAPRAGVNK